ncbi:Alpha/Beta hydrolase protein [Cytidiella melzeri]|nr:Alpha/Beta hydrolase protein [Cytidiella melzeri]
MDSFEEKGGGSSDHSEPTNRDGLTVKPDKPMPLSLRAFKWTLMLSAAWVLFSRPYNTNELSHIAFLRGLKSAFQKEYGVVVSHSMYDKHREDPDKIWNRLPVSWPQLKDTVITWTPCYVEKECARLMLPLDYLREESLGNSREESSGPYTGIAMLRVPAKVPQEDPTYGGPILFNPGGPGGSGVALINTHGDQFQHIVGEEYDIVGFDPRGIGQSTPRVVVFPDEAEGAAWLMKEPAAVLFNHSSDAVAGQLARSTVYNTLFHQRARHAAQYASTASVARDMLEIMKAHGRDKLQYWGFSYGSVLGATFAAMFPDNVGRLVIDGVMDTKSYYDTLWHKNLVDTDTGLSMFFEACVEAGPRQCGLYESSAYQVKSRYDSLMDNLLHRPVAVSSINQWHSSALDYGIIDYSIVKAVIFRFLYSPYMLSPGMPSFASQLSFLLSEIEQGNGLPMWNVLKSGLPYFTCSCTPNAPKPTLRHPDALWTYMCGDGEVVEDTAEEYAEYLAHLNSSFADMWALRGHCSNWKVRPRYRFTGPYGGNTSFPLLIIGNTADPVTPLASAHAVARDFNGSSVVLTQNSAGHCSLAAPSLCTAKAIGEYFREGKLPEPGTVCEIETKMFGDDLSPSFSSLPMSEDRESLVMEALRSLNEVYSMPDFGLAREIGPRIMY